MISPGRSGEEHVATVFPSWLQFDCDRDRWLQEWRAGAHRREVVAIAESFSSTGFDVNGTQWHPKAVSVIAQDAHCSIAAAKRFLAKARAAKMLMKIGQVQLVEGMRSTPMYQLTVPFQLPVPATINGELGDLARLFPADEVDAARLTRPWRVATAPPEWVPISTKLAA